MITDTTAKSTYTTLVDRYDYPIGFVYDYNTDGTPQIKVYLNRASTTPLEYNTDYTISDDGLSIILTSVTAGDRLDIIRDIPLKQQSDYSVGRVDPEQIERDLDLAVERDQQLHGDMQFLGEVPLDHEERIQQNEADINTIESYIPAQTTTENQLADKDFVNSSIATSTATFRGTYDSLVELEAVTADANDYGFVVSTDAAGNTLYSRYKYDGTNWVFEYDLNNSSFTAAQWAAINSGITEGMVAAYHNTTGRNVGDIFFTTRLDNGLNGAVACDGTQYNTTDFTGASAVGALLEAGKLPYVSLSQYATLLSTNGSVGVFGWDGIGTIAFRVPSLNDIFIETGTAAQIGDYIAPGLPDTTLTIPCSKMGSNIADHGAYWNMPFDSVTVKLSDGSNSIYGASDTVQPNTVRYRAMVQLMVSATDEAVATCTAVASQVAANTAAISGADYVVESQLPTADNNYTWYRKYKSGWVEQGGQVTQVTTSQQALILPIEMSDVNYQVLSNVVDDNLSNYVFCVQIKNKTATGFDTQVWGSYQGGTTTSGYNFVWQVSGIAA